MLPKPTGKDRDSSLRIDKAPGILSSRTPQLRTGNVGGRRLARQRFHAGRIDRKMQCAALYDKFDRAAPCRPFHFPCASTPWPGAPRRGSAPLRPLGVLSRHQGDRGVSRRARGQAARHRGAARWKTTEGKGWSPPPVEPLRHALDAAGGVGERLGDTIGQCGVLGGGAVAGATQAGDLRLQRRDATLRLG